METTLCVLGMVREPEAPVVSGEGACLPDAGA